MRCWKLLGSGTNDLLPFLQYSPGHNSLENKSAIIPPENVLVCGHNWVWLRLYFRMLDPKFDGNMAPMDKGGNLFSRTMPKVGGSLAFLGLLWELIKQVLDWGGRYQLLKESLPHALKFLSEPGVSILVFAVGCFLIIWAWYDLKHSRSGKTAERPKARPVPPQPTLLSLFKTDFPTVFKKN